MLGAHSPLPLSLNSSFRIQVLLFYWRNQKSPFLISLLTKLQVLPLCYEAFMDMCLGIGTIWWYSFIKPTSYKGYDEADIEDPRLTPQVLEQCIPLVHGSLGHVDQAISQLICLLGSELDLFDQLLLFLLKLLFACDRYRGCFLSVSHCR